MSNIFDNGNKTGILVTPKLIASAVGMLTLLTALTGVIWKFQSYEFRLTQMEYVDQVEKEQFKALISEFKSLKTETKNLRSSITDLTIELREFKAMQTPPPAPLYRSP